VSDILEPLIAPIRAALVALLGLWLAWSWFSGSGWLPPLCLVLASIVAAHACTAWGRKELPRRPLLALFLMEMWILAPLLWGALASCVIVILAVALQPPEGTPTADQQLAKALAAAITAFLTSGFISWSGDRDKSPVARRTKAAFHEAYKGFELPRDIERVVYSEAVRGLNGWAWPARYARARQLHHYLKGHRLNHKGHDRECNL
jgi:hypothetical protein